MVAMFDPVFGTIAIGKRILVVCVVGILVAMMIKYRDKVIIAITGDDRIHGTPLDCIWIGLFRCCGLCSGDYVHCLGRYLGVAPWTVQLSCITVGDLPDHHAGDFYLTIECGGDPPMVTSVAERREPKVVHFPDVLTLRVRSSSLEPSLRITVKRLNLVGSTTLCEVQITARSVTNWAFSSANFKRVQMFNCDATFNAETPPWIALKFGGPDEEEYSTSMDAEGQVRTLSMLGGVKNFKNEYGLLDATGNFLAEPFEEDLELLARQERCLSWFTRAMIFLGICVPMAFYGTWKYASFCYDNYKAITMAELNNQTFPMSVYQIQHLVEWCEVQFAGEGIAVGEPCKPSFEQVYAVCTPSDEGGRFPAAQPELAFPIPFASDFDVPGLPCFDWACWGDFHVQPFEPYAPLMVLAYFLVVSLLRTWGRHCVRASRASMQRERAQQMQSTMRNTK